MKTLKYLVSLLVASACLGSSAETIKVIALNVGQIGGGGLSADGKADISAMLNDAEKDVDFGYFCGPKADNYFNASDANYTFDKALCVQSVGGTHAFVYRTDRYELLKRYEKVGLGNGGVDACVVKNKETGATYAMVMPSGNQFNVASSGKVDAYCAGIKAVMDNCLADYPAAKVFVGTTIAWGSTYADLKTYLTSSTYLGLREARAAETAGGIYYEDDPAAAATVANVTVRDVASPYEPAVVATLSYRDQVTIAFKDWDGTELGSSTVYQGEDATPPADPSREGYDFTGWDGSYENVQSSATLTAQYAIKQFTVTFKDWDGEVLKEETVDYGTDATPPADPERTDYRFLGWQGSYQNVQADSEVVATYAQASAKTYWVTFVDFDGTEIQKSEIIEGESAVAPSDPIREGYDFTGWDGSYQNVQQDETVTATYAIKTFEVTFKDSTGGVVKVQTVNWHDSATPPTAPELAGHTFAAWVGNWENVEHAETVTATYTINSYTVTFVAEGEVVDTQTVEYRQAASMPAEPVSKDETLIFDGWDTDFTCVTGDITVTAIFIEGVYPVGTAAEFVEKVPSVATKAKATVKLTADIDLAGASYQAVAEFRATLDGAGHALTGLGNSGRLFEKLYGSVRNLRFVKIGTGTTINDNCGIVARNAYGATIDSCTFEDCLREHKSTNNGGAGVVYAASADETGKITVITNCTMKGCRITGVTGSGQKIGGFVAVASDTRICDCRFLTDDTTRHSVGGVAGHAGGIVAQVVSPGRVTVERCFVEGAVRGESGDTNSAGVGGIVGGATGTCEVYDCTNTAAVVGFSLGGTGGIVGRACKTPVTVGRCVNYGDVSGEVYAYVKNNTSGHGVGGIFGGAWYNTSTTTIFDSDNFGKLTSGTNEVAVGGIVGFPEGQNGRLLLKLTNCFNHGDVYSVMAAGGLIGDYSGVDAKAFVHNCGSSGNVTAERGAAGGLAGCIEYNLNNSILDVNGLMVCGGVSNATGVAGLCVGRAGAVGTPGSGNGMSVKCAVLAGTVSAPLGTTGALCAQLQDGVTANMTHDANCRLVDTTLDSTIEPMAATDLVSLKTVKLLTDNATANEWMPWIRGTNNPELERFGTPSGAGMFIIFW